MKRDLDMGEFLFKVVFWKLLCLALVAILLYAPSTQEKPADTFEWVVVSVMACLFMAAAIFTELGDG